MTQSLSSETPAAGVSASGGHQWRLHVGFGLVALTWLICLLPTYLSLMDTWARTGTFQFGFLIFPVCAVLIWSRRAWLARLVARPEPRALWLAAALSGIWLLGALMHINLAQHLAAVAIWPVWIYLFYGRAVARVLGFPMGYVLFAVPFGNFMVGPLQTVTAHLAVFSLHLVGMPVLMDGHFIETPAAAWHVATACSGIKFFVATTAFGVLYAWIFYTSLNRRLIFIACSMIVPIIANGLRVFFTILIGEHFGIQYATGTDHVIFGWQFFGSVLVLLFFAGWPFHQAPTPMVVPATPARPARIGQIMRVTVAGLLVTIVPALVVTLVSQFMPNLVLDLAQLLGQAGNS